MRPLGWLLVGESMLYLNRLNLVVKELSFGRQFLVWFLSKLLLLIFVKLIHYTKLSSAVISSNKVSDRYNDCRCSIFSCISSQYFWCLIKISEFYGIRCI